VISTATRSLFTFSIKGNSCLRASLAVTDIVGSLAQWYQVTVPLAT
jgi:hypothetical protein